MFWRSWCKKGPTPGQEIPIAPDEPDVLVGVDVVEGIGAGELATGLPSVAGWVVACGSRDGVLLAAWLQ